MGSPHAQAPAVRGGRLTQALLLLLWSSACGESPSEAVVVGAGEGRASLRAPGLAAERPASEPSDALAADGGAEHAMGAGRPSGDGFGAARPEVPPSLTDCGALAALDAAAAPPRAGPWFVEDPAGVDHVDHSGPTGAAKHYLRDCIGQGLAVLDVDGDGRLDLYFARGQDAQGGDGHNLLYRNAGPRRFEALPRAGGADDPGFSFGVLAFDADADGDTDLLSSNDGPNRLYLNVGGAFVDVSADQPDLVGADDAWSTGAAAADLDLDGDLDVYLAQYLVHDPADLERRGWCRFMGCEVPCGPLGLTPLPDLWLRNDDGRFVEAGAELGLDAAPDSFAFQPLFSDVDDDGDLDLYVTNDSRANYLFVNDGGRFVEDGLVAGVAVGRSGNREAGMGVASASIDGDSFPELYVTNFSTQVNALYVNQGEPGLVWFEEQAELRGLGTPTYFLLSWGTSFGDFDADGLLDLFVANGHVFPQVDGCPPEDVVYRQPPSLFGGRSRDGRVWADLGASAGGAFARPTSLRGSLVADLDDDGDLDLLASRLDDRPLLLWNESPERGHWLSVLVQQPGRDDAATLSAGARVDLRADGRRWSREVQVGSSFLCTEDPRLFFGLGDVAVVQELLVRWPDGTRARFVDVPVDRHLVALAGAADLTEASR